MRARQTKTRWACAALAVALLLGLCGCSAKFSATRDAAATDEMSWSGQMNQTSAAEEFGYFEAADMAAPEAAPSEMAGDAVTGGYRSGDADTAALSRPGDGRKVILRAEVSLEAKDYDEALQTLLERVAAMGGYLASREDYDYGRKEVSLCVRVPSDRFDAFLGGMEEIANVTRLAQSAQDITESYLETQSYLESLTTQQTRLLELMAQAETLEDLLAIEDRLAEVRAQLQYYASLKNAYDSQIDDATIDISLCEVRDYTVTEPTFGEQLLAALQNSGRGFLRFLQDLLFTVIDLAPYLVILVPLGILALRALRRRRARRKAATAQLPQPPQPKRQRGEEERQEEQAQQEEREQREE